MIALSAAESLIPVVCSYTSEGVRCRDEASSDGNAEAITGGLGATTFALGLDARGADRLGWASVGYSMRPPPGASSVDEQESSQLKPMQTARAVGAFKETR